VQHLLQQTYPSRLGSMVVGINELLILFFLLIITYVVISLIVDQKNKVEGFISNIKDSKEYKEQFAKIRDRFEGKAGGKRPVDELLKSISESDLPKDERCLVNFYALSTRFTGYLGPFENGFFDADKAVDLAVKAGVRTFILEIDYFESCKDPIFFPKLVVRDIRGRSMINPESDVKCQTISTSYIRAVASAIAKHAFASYTQNRLDPVIVVIYGLRLPPVENQLDYMSNIAKCLEPLVSYQVDSLMNKKYNRQSNEGSLLINDITDYEGRVLLFANMDTTMFRDKSVANKYKPKEDLDYLVNLRLAYRQSQLGCTCQPSSGSYGILDSAQEIMNLPTGSIMQTMQDTKLKWTVALSKDPSIPVDEEIYIYVTEKIGVQCVPILLWDEKNTFMFTDKRFAKYSFIPKPKNLRYIKPGIAVPAKPSPAMNADGGKVIIGANPSMSK
jgi:hypothetical protein